MMTTRLWSVRSGGREGRARPAASEEDRVRDPLRTANAKKGWRDLAATIRNPLADAWDFLTRTPQANVPTNYPLRGELGTVTRDGKTYERWQHKPTKQGDARIWFYVDGWTVLLEQVHTSHPNEK